MRVVESSFDGPRYVFRAVLISCAGHYLRVVAISSDCDDDAVLVKVNPEGPTCHTGERSCFHHVVSG